MKYAYIIHGWEGRPEERLHVWMRGMLETHGYIVSVPNMPDPSYPRIDAWLKTLNELIQPSDELLLVGHSVGAQAILRYVAQMSFEPTHLNLVLIAPWLMLDEQTILQEGADVVEMGRPWVEIPIDFEAVKRRAKRIIAVFSDDDPFVDVSQEIMFKDVVSAQTLMLHGMGHFCDDDPYGYEHDIEAVIFSENR